MKHRQKLYIVIGLLVMFLCGAVWVSSKARTLANALEGCTLTDYVTVNHRAEPESVYYCPKT